MNKRARNRLIGVTAIILVIVAAIFASMSAGTGAKSYSTVAEIRNDAGAVGKRITVGGTVVPGSWDKGSTDKMRFAIADGDKEGNIKDPSVKLDVVYSGTMPATFGDKVTAIVIGELKPGGVLESNEPMLVKCPEKKESGTAATTVDNLLKSKDKLAGLPLRVKGFIVAASIKPVGTTPRLEIQTADGSVKLPVLYTGGIPDGVKDGADVVLGGAIDKEGVFDATSIALTK